MTLDEAIPLVNQALLQMAETTTDLVEWTNLMSDSKYVRANEDAQIYHHLYNGFMHILDHDTFPALMDPQGYQKEFKISGHSLQIRVAHRAPGIEKLHGVDIIYNLSNRKGLVFQHKKRSVDGKLAFGKKERLQQKTIQGKCNLCSHYQAVHDSPTYVLPQCASLYVIGDTTSGIRHVVSACQVDSYRTNFGNSATEKMDHLPHPSDMQTIDHMFLQCNVGRIITAEKGIHELERIREELLEVPDLVFNANLKRLPGLFSEDVHANMHN